MQRVRVEVQNNILEWAIRRAGHELSDFVIQNPKVAKWLENKKQPTLKQLEDFSKKLHVPFGYLLLKEPPAESIDFTFFRTGQARTHEVSLNVYDAVQIIQSRQDWLREHLIEEGFEALSFVGKFSIDDEVQEVVNDIRQTLGLDVDWARRIKNWTETLTFLSTHIEEVGITINFNGVVGNSTKRKIKVEECRGFVLVDHYAPFLFINNRDAKAAQIFTMIHELVHIWIGYSAGFDMANMLPSNDPIEIFCDKVAAEFLVPKAYFLEVWEEEKNFLKLNRIFKVSPIVIARRALDLKLIPKAQYFSFYYAYIKKMSGLRTKQAESGGGNFYATAKKKISPRFAGFVHSAVKEGKLLYKDAYKLTGLRGDTYENFIQKTLL